MAELIANGTTVVSAEFTVVAGTPATVFLKAAGALPKDAEGLIEAKAADGTYTVLGAASLTVNDPVRIIDGAGTWRVTRRASAGSYGVEKN